QTIHIVGGGALNELLCQRTADRAGLPVLAGPVEATALGNILVQARAIGLIDGSLEDLRYRVVRTHPPRRFAPSGRTP
ncbi:MAG TPA: rhamnulokinase, partial [Microbacterium sp.]|nr:rhamnulokinase [Microbacterium sp.]